MPGNDPSAITTFDVGVAVVPLRESVPSPRAGEQRAVPSSIPGYDEAAGRHGSGKTPYLIEKGEAAVEAATEAIASQIGLTAHRIAAAVSEQIPPPLSAGSYAAESLSISFGVTIAAGLQAMFTAQAESSVQVTVTLSRRPGPAGSGAA